MPAIPLMYVDLASSIAPAKPGYLESIIDPVFGSKITRVVDGGLLPNLNPLLVEQTLFARMARIFADFLNQSVSISLIRG
jgi:hypothetical protein